MVLTTVCTDPRTDQQALTCFFTFAADAVVVACSAVLEGHKVASTDWGSRPLALLFGYTACLFALYSLVPFLLQRSSATMLNLSLLTSDVYSLLFGLFLFHYKFSGLYFVGFAMVLIGLVVYNRGAPEVASRQPAPPEQTSTVAINSGGLAAPGIHQ
eukprot:m.204098 g.204098  ORF g.204098 m.204098 type:complete len:157 (+) comp18461_c1_seq3:109-579(+)